MSVNSLILKYPLDLTGKSPTNLIVNEPHTLGEVTDRAFVTNCGPFFTESVVVREAVTGRELTKIEEYLILQPYEEATLRSGLEVASIIYIKDLSIDTEILVDYQVVGGEFSWSVEALRTMLETIDLNAQPVHWGDIIGRPVAFPPTPHLHDLGDSYGWEYITQQLEGIRNAILIGDAASHDELRKQLMAYVESLQDGIDAISRELSLHESNHNNPHVVTKAQVGLGSVENFGIATDAEAMAGASTTKYMTPFATNKSAVVVATLILQNHASNHNNPHVVTKAQVGLGNVDNYTTATKAEAEAGTSSTTFMTPLRTAQAIAASVSGFSSHLTDFNNPHNTTKAQVGLGNVENFGIATDAEAMAGASTTKYMTPFATNKSAVVVATLILQNHASNHNNPHVVTKAQVGLGNVDNFLTATQLEAEAGTSSTTFMTPQRFTQALKVAVKDTMTTHINDHNNPHVTTAAQVGAYTTTQTDNLIAGRLAVGGTAVNSSKLENNSLAQVLAAAYAQVGSMGKRALFVSTADPVAATGVIGDVWFKY